jgi:hypothetical protein
VSSLAVHSLMGKRVLVTRESARGLAPAIRSAIDRERRTVGLDFDHVDGITPSFLDELLSVVQELFAVAQTPSFRVEILHPPTELSSKFAAIGRGRDLKIVETQDGWVIAREAPAARTA